jgi:acyl carrier protein
MSDRSEVLARVQNVASKIFRCDPAAIGAATTAADVNGWDSLTHTHFLMEIEREFGIRFSLERVFRAETVGDLLAEIESLVA